MVTVVLPFIAMLNFVLFKSPAGIRSNVAFNFSVVPASVLPFFVLSTKVGWVSLEASAEIGAVVSPDGDGVIRSNVVFNFSVVPASVLPFSVVARVSLPFTSLPATVDQVSSEAPVKIVVVPDAVSDVDCSVLLVQYNEEVLQAFVAAASVLKFVAISDLACFEASAKNELAYNWIREKAAARSNTISEII